MVFHQSALILSRKSKGEDLKTAKTLSLTVLPFSLATADEMIE